LEVLAARLAAERIDPSGAAVLDRLLATARTTRHVVDLAVLNTRFHDTVSTLSGNTLLTGMMEPLHGRLQWVYRQSVEARAAQSWAEHRELATAIRAGDAEAAAAAARAHVMAARQSALALANGIALRTPAGDVHTGHDLAR